MKYCICKKWKKTHFRDAWGINSIDIEDNRENADYALISARLPFSLNKFKYCPYCGESLKTLKYMGETRSFSTEDKNPIRTAMKRTSDRRSCGKGHGIHSSQLPAAERSEG